MKIFRSAASARVISKQGLAVTMGNFDGLHAGHRWIMGELIKAAKHRGLPAVAYTFDPHPAKLLAPHAAPPALNTLNQKIALFRELGLSALIIESFDRNFARQTPEDFFQTTIMNQLRAAYLMVGYDFTFGAKRSGTIETLEQLCVKNNVECRIIAPQMFGQTLVSSTVVRQNIRDGRVEEVMSLLKRPYFIEGTIIHGDKRGRELGFPTINLESENELIPKPGVYLVELGLGKQLYWGLTNIGVRPTLKINSPLTIETHLPRLEAQVYGKRARLFFWCRLRDEKNFASMSALINQIKRDLLKGEKLQQKIKTQKKLAPYLQWTSRFSTVSL